MAERRGSAPAPLRAARRRALTRSVAALVLIAAAGCAPHRVVPGALEPTLRSARYRVALERREARGNAVDAQLLMWAEAPAGTRLPGVEGRLQLAGPDAFRLRVASLFGTAIDLGAHGESLSAFIPSQRRGVRLDASRDSLGIARPGGLAFRALTATWRPPDQAWRSPAWDDSLMRLWWLEGGDTLAIAVGSGGLPARATFRRPGGTDLLIEYLAWDLSSGVAWPARFTVVDRDGAFRLACRLSRVRFPVVSDSLRLTVPIPAGAVQLTVADLRRVLERLGTL
jgi:hypothetical protein